GLLTRLPGIRRHEQGGAAGAAISGRPFSPRPSRHGKKARRGDHRMRGSLRGEDYAQVDNHDPFAPPVWRSPVYRTPEWVIWLVQLARLAWAAVKFIVRHPLLDLAAALTWLAWRLA